MKLSIAIALSMLLSLPGQAEGLVLCFSHTGDMAVELGCEGTACCTEAHGDCDEPHETPIAHAEHDSCSCTDIPLLAGACEEAISARAPDLPTPPEGVPAQDADPLHVLRMDEQSLPAYERVFAPAPEPTPVSLATRLLL